MKLSRDVSVLANRHFVWFGQRSLDCIGLHRFLDFKSILCCDYGLEVELISATVGAPVISVEQQSGVREKWTNFSLEKLFEGQLGSQIAASLLTHKKQLDILAYCSTADLECLTAQSEGRVRILAAKASLKRHLDNKIAFRAILPTLGIDPVPGQVVKLGTVRFQEVSDVYGVPFVVQLPIGSAGNGTFFISTKTELEDLQRVDDSADVIVSKYIEGPSPNINAVVLDNLTLLSYPSIQLVGIRECTNWLSAYCGNDFSATRHLSQPALAHIYDQTQRIGNWLRQNGFRGLFGVDFVIENHEVYPVEVNPRFQGSTPVLTQAQISNGQLPLALAHVWEFLAEDKRDPLEWEQGWPQPVPGAQMILHNNVDRQCTVKGLLKPGVYVLRDGGPRFMRPGLSLLDCHSTDEFVVTCAVPRPGTKVDPGAPLLKIQAFREALDMNTKFLKPWASQACQWAQDALLLG